MQISLRSLTAAAVIAVFWGPIAHAQTPPETAPPQRFGLSDLLNLAEKKNFTLAEGRLKLDAARAGVTSARSTLLPRLLVEGSGGLAYPSETWTSFANVVVRQNIFDGGKSWTAMSRAQIARDRSVLDEKLARENMTIDVLNAFVKCSLLESQLASSRRKLSLLEQQFDLVNRQFRQGLKNQRDYQRLEADVELSRLGIERAQADLFAAYRTLESTVGSDDMKMSGETLALYNGEKILSLSGWQPDKTEFKVQSANLEVQSAELLSRDRDLALGEARRLYLPAITLDASVGYGSASFLGTGTAWRAKDQWSGALALTLNWTLWDWGGVPAKVSIARADHLLEERRFVQKKLEVTSRFVSLSQDLERRSRIVEVQKRVRELEQKSFENIQKEYREGRAGYLDLINALDRGARAEISFEEEAFAYFLSVAEFFKLKGSLYENAQKL